MIPLADFEACVLDAPIASFNKVDVTSVWQAYSQASANAPSPCKEVFQLLGAIASIRLNPAERGRIWVPRFSSGGQRSMIPSDIRGTSQNARLRCGSCSRSPRGWSRAA